MSFSNKVVIVTGASSGIGAATAELFAKEGADVVMVGRNQTKLSDVAARCQLVGKKPLVVRADVSNDDGVKSIIEQTINTYGKIDVLVNNAGLLHYGTLLDGDFVKAYDAVMETNLRATVQLTSLAAPYLVKTKGNVVNISSTCSTTILEFRYTAYSMTKAAMDHFTRGASIELAPFGVRVNSVNPGPVSTGIITAAEFEGSWDDIKKMTTLNRVSEPEEIGELIMFLASDKARGITGSCFLSDNGMNLKR